MHLDFCRYVRPIRLSDVERGRENNLNLLRFLFATSVIVSHSWVALGLLNTEPVHRYMPFTDLGAIAVSGFFFLSGYLIVKSALSWKSPVDYLASRSLRIFPGLSVAVVACTLLLGPALTTWQLGDYFSSPETFASLSEVWMHRMQHTLPGVCTNHALPSLNASLWTLPGEWLMYMLTMLACLVFQWRSLKGLNFIAWGIVTLALLFTLQMLPLQWPFATQWFRCFALGAFCYLLRKHLPLWVPGAVALLLIEVVVVRYHLKGAQTLFTLAICYAMLTLGFHPAVHMSFAHRFGDYSYGLYIYGLPVQQALLTHIHTPVPLFVASFPIVLLLAVLSWHFIEQPALKLKHSRRLAWLTGLGH